VEQTGVDRGKAGSILSVINDVAGAVCNADIDVPGIQTSGEFYAQKSGGGVRIRFFGIYGNRKADLRGTLGDRYCCLRNPKRRAVYAV
jgi:hypothetical protein